MTTVVTNIVLNPSNDKTLYKLWYGSKLEIEYLCIQDCLAYTHILKEWKDGKLYIDRATKYIFIEYMPLIKIWGC